jgi:hypothetical protein
VSLEVIPTIRGLWLLLTGMMLVSRVLFQAAGAPRMRQFLEVWKVGRVRRVWGAASLVLAAVAATLIVRDHRLLDARDWTLGSLLVAVLVADGSVNVLPSGFETFKDRVQTAWVRRNAGTSRADDSHLFGVVNLGLAIAAGAMFAFVTFYRPASALLLVGAIAAAVVLTPLLVGLGLAEGRRHVQ